MKTAFYTGNGDDGQTRVGAKAIPKSSPLLSLLGSLDELNSWLGLCRVEADRMAERLQGGAVNIAGACRAIQEALFRAQAQIGSLAFDVERPKTVVHGKHTRVLEKLIADIDGVVPKLTTFVVPGGSELSARLDVARTLARRLERTAVAVHRSKPLPDELLEFLNRLSSALFALARYANVVQGVPEEPPAY
ncbi:MAG: cob(I)yrinic acid a,c-diamide adenosyltransferase [bacterium]|nr:cob(I)yrinic acid a,c-diamide adenosyltransferase [bacterium]